MYLYILCVSVCIIRVLSIRFPLTSSSSCCGTTRNAGRYILYYNMYNAVIIVL